jgi:death on curing protein
VVEEIQFLTPSEVEDLHRESIDRFGGEFGLRDRGLLESAVYAPQQTFDGVFLYSTIYEMAAALWHGLVSNHPFVDGNKRVGTAVADVFLLVNGIEMTFSTEEVISITMALATSNLIAPICRTELPEIPDC